MLKDSENKIVYENQIEELFIQYCDDNNIDLSKRNIDDNDAYCIWSYIYNILFKPDKDTIRYNHKNSKLNYGDIDTLNIILDTYLKLCFNYKILPSISDFCLLTGISLDTINSWEREEHRYYIYYDADYNIISNLAAWKASHVGQEPPHKKASSGYSDIAKKIKNSTRNMTIKDLHNTTMGQVVIANNLPEAGLMFAQNQAIAQAEAWRKPRISRGDLLGIEDAAPEDGGKADF